MSFIVMGMLVLVMTMLIFGGLCVAVVQTDVCEVTGLSMMLSGLLGIGLIMYYVAGILPATMLVSLPIGLVITCGAETSKGRKFGAFILLISLACGIAAMVVTALQP